MDGWMDGWMDGRWIDWLLVGWIGWLIGWLVETWRSEHFQDPTAAVRKSQLGLSIVETKSNQYAAIARFSRRGKKRVCSAN
jgi:hypothetical protein